MEDSNPSSENVNLEEFLQTLQNQENEASVNFSDVQSEMNNKSVLVNQSKMSGASIKEILDFEIFNKEASQLQKNSQQENQSIQKNTNLQSENQYPYCKRQSEDSSNSKSQVSTAYLQTGQSLHNQIFTSQHQQNFKSSLDFQDYPIIQRNGQFNQISKEIGQLQCENERGQQKDQYVCGCLLVDESRSHQYVCQIY